MAYKECPKCGSQKNLFLACQSCGFTECGSQSENITRPKTNQETLGNRKKYLVCTACPKCGSPKHRLNACPACGYTNRTGGNAVDYLRHAREEMRILLGQLPGLDKEQQRLKFVEFVQRGKWHYEVAQRFIQRLNRELNRKIRDQGFHEGAHVPGSNLRKIDGNRKSK